jgi:phosphohistidine phosphatase SixA
MFKKLSIMLVIIFTVLLTITIAEAKPKFFQKEVNKEQAINSLKKGGMIVFVRHTYAPKVEGNMTKGYDGKKPCEQQRNLLSEGKKQAEDLGNFIRENNIGIEKAYASPICRCWETAEIAGIEFEKNNLFQAKNWKKDQKVKQMRDIIKSWNGKGNLFVFTHFKVMKSVFSGFKADNGQMLVVNNNLKQVGVINIPYNFNNIK